MKATLRVEAIGENIYQMTSAYKSALSSMYPELGTMLNGPKRPYWCAIIYDKNEFGYLKNFLSGKKDYSKANSKGSRGVFIWYTLLSGYVYEVSSPINWNRTRRYFITVANDGEILEITKKEVDQWIKDHLV